MLPAASRQANAVPAPKCHDTVRSRGQHVRMIGCVTHLYVTATAAAPMEPRTEIKALADIGIEGDRYAVGAGEYSSRGGRGRHLTLIAQEAIDEANAELDSPLAPGEHRRSIVTQAVDLMSLLGRRFRIGEVECEGVRTCPPCTYLDGVVGRRVYDALTDRSGIRADITSSGIIRVGDPIELLDAPA
jgi:MOSC domain-containing protein YiiM